MVVHHSILKDGFWKKFTATSSVAYAVGQLIGSQSETADYWESYKNLYDHGAMNFVKAW